MKKILILICLLLGSSALVLAGNVITSQGIGKIKIGAKIDKLPKTVSGLYDKLVMEEEEEFYEGGDSDIVTLYKAYSGDQLIFTIRPYDGKVYGIEVNDASVTTQNGLSLASTPAELLEAGAKTHIDNDGYEGLLCDGVLFICNELTRSGVKKAEEAYASGLDVEMTASDFKADSHPTSIRVWNGLVDESAPAPAKKTGKPVGEWLPAVLILAILLGMIVHMSYVLISSRPHFPEDFSGMTGKPENNEVVIREASQLYNEWTPIATGDEKPDEEIVRWPLGKEEAYRSHDLVVDMIQNKLPVDGEAADWLKKLCVILNMSFTRTFSGSSRYIIVTIIVAIILFFVGGKSWGILATYGVSIALYWLSCMAPSYISMKADYENLEREKRGEKIKETFMNRVLDKVNLQNATDGWFDIILRILLYFFLALIMPIPATINYIKNYIRN